MILLLLWLWLLIMMMTYLADSIPVGMAGLGTVLTGEIAAASTWQLSCVTVNNLTASNQNTLVVVVAAFFIVGTSFRSIRLRVRYSRTPQQFSRAATTSTSQDAYRDVLLLLQQGLSGPWHDIRAKRQQGRCLHLVAIRHNLKRKHTRNVFTYTECIAMFQTAS